MSLRLIHSLSVGCCCLAACIAKESSLGEEERSMPAADDNRCNQGRAQDGMDFAFDEVSAGAGPVDHETGKDSVGGAGNE
jgi:hypothetical protein